MLARSMRRAGVCFALVCTQMSLALPAPAAAPTAALRGVVTAAGKPIANASVELHGNDATVRTASDVLGRFTFPPLPFGTYDLTAQRGNLRAHVRVDLGSDGANLSIALVPLAEIHEVTVYRSPTVRGSGS